MDFLKNKKHQPIKIVKKKMNSTGQNFTVFLIKSYCVYGILDYKLSWPTSEKILDKIVNTS